MLEKKLRRDDKFVSPIKNVLRKVGRKLAQTNSRNKASY